MRSIGIRCFCKRMVLSLDSLSNRIQWGVDPKFDVRWNLCPELALFNDFLLRCSRRGPSGRRSASPASSVGLDGPADLGFGIRALAT